MIKPGDKNSNRQQLLRITEAKGTDFNARVWVLKCLNCGAVYGCNSTDAWERKCPNCQSGRPGLNIPIERDGENWSRAEHIIAFNLYNQIPFGTIHMRNPKVIELAAILGRKVGSVSYKLANLARFDPALQARGIRGMPRGAKGEELIWREFTDHPEALAYESERLLAERLGESIEQIADIDTQDLPAVGIEREATVRVRVNQSFFRRRILSAYKFRCCVTGLAVRELLVASHIVPWAQDAANRLNPRNGLCLNALHDRAFDRRLMWIDEKMRVRFAAKLHEPDKAANPSLAWLLGFEGEALRLPEKFSPGAEFLLKHEEKCKASQ